MQTYAFIRPAAPCVQAGVGACRRDHLAWNFEAITATLAQFTCVKLYMAGVGLTRACLLCRLLFRHKTRLLMQVMTILAAMHTTAAFTG